MKNRLLGVILALVAVGVGYFAYQSLPTEKPTALVYEPARALEPFVLESSLGAPVTQESLHEQWTLLFTGYTFCPDICPTTMAELRRILPELQQATNWPVRVWMISVDPQRDTLQRVTDYATFFGEEFVGVRADHPELYPFVTGLGLMYSIPRPEDQDYLVNHSAAIVLVNPRGERTAIFNAEHELGAVPTVNMAQLAKDFSLIAPKFR